MLKEGTQSIKGGFLEKKMSCFPHDLKGRWKLGSQKLWSKMF